MQEFNNSQVHRSATTPEPWPFLPSLMEVINNIIENIFFPSNYMADAYDSSSLWCADCSYIPLKGFQQTRTSAATCLQNSTLPAVLLVAFCPPTVTLRVLYKIGVCPIIARPKSAPGDGWPFENRFTKAFRRHWSRHIEEIIKCLKLTSGVRVHSGEVSKPDPTNTSFWCLIRETRPSRSFAHSTNHQRLSLKNYPSDKRTFQKPGFDATLWHIWSGFVL